MKFLKKLFWILLIGLAVIQFIRPDKNISVAAPVNHLSQKFNVPEDVRQILSTSCYDCHSNNTRYPWYYSVQPVAWWLNSHVNEAKEHLNFDEFASYRLRKQYHKFEEITEMIDENEMPLPSFTFIHRDASLSQEQKERIIAWSKLCMEVMKVSYPIDSLIKK